MKSDAESVEGSQCSFEESLTEDNIDFLEDNDDNDSVKYDINM